MSGALKFLWLLYSLYSYQIEKYSAENHKALLLEQKPPNLVIDSILLPSESPVRGLRLNPLVFIPFNYSNNPCLTNKFPQFSRNSFLSLSILEWSYALRTLSPTRWPICLWMISKFAYIFLLWGMFWGSHKFNPNSVKCGAMRSYFSPIWITLSPYSLEVREDHKEPNASDTNGLEEKRKSGSFTEYYRNSVLEGRK